MRFETLGEVVAGFHVLGTTEVPVYLLDGAEPVVFDAGMSCFGRTYEAAIRETLGPGRAPARLCVTHSHFDHIGSVTFLKRAFPSMQIVASQKVADVMTRPSAVSRIQMLSAAGTLQARQLGAARFGVTDLVEEPFEPFELDRVVADGDELVGADGLRLEVLATPGHTWDFMSYYLPERKILIASESLGLSDREGYIYSEFLVDYDAYLASLERLAALDVDVLCQGHMYVFTGDDAKAHVARSIASAKEHRRRIEELLDEEGGDIGRVVARVKAEEWEPRPDPKQHEAAYMLNVNARVKHLAQRRAARG